MVLNHMLFRKMFYIYAGVSSLQSTHFVRTTYFCFAINSICILIYQAVIGAVKLGGFPTPPLSLCWIDVVRYRSSKLFRNIGLYTLFLFCFALLWLFCFCLYTIAVYRSMWLTYLCPSRLLRWHGGYGKLKHSNTANNQQRSNHVHNSWMYYMCRTEW